MANGSSIRAARPAVTEEARIWKAIRAYHSFSFEDVAEFGLCSEERLREYLGALESSGILRLSGRKGVARYILARDPGPVPPSGQDLVRAEPGAAKPRRKNRTRAKTKMKQAVELLQERQEGTWVSELMEALGVDHIKADRILAILVQEGFLERDERVRRDALPETDFCLPRQNRFYRIVRSLAERKVGYRRCSRDTLWEIIRGLSQFTVSDIIKTSECSQASVHNYVSTLFRNGHLQRTRKIGKQYLYSHAALPDKARPAIQESLNRHSMK